MLVNCSRQWLFWFFRNGGQFVPDGPTVEFIDNSSCRPPQNMCGSPFWGSSDSRSSQAPVASPCNFGPFHGFKRGPGSTHPFHVRSVCEPSLRRAAYLEIDALASTEARLRSAPRRTALSNSRSGNGFSRTGHTALPCRARRVGGRERLARLPGNVQGRLFASSRRNSVRTGPACVSSGPRATASARTWGARGRRFALRRRRCRRSRDRR
jgi:hypothetical protein